MTDGHDRFWLRLTNEDDQMVQMSIEGPASQEAVAIGGGNITVPKQLPKGVQ